MNITQYDMQTANRHPNAVKTLGFAVMVALNITAKTIIPGIDKRHRFAGRTGSIDAENAIITALHSVDAHNLEASINAVIEKYGNPYRFTEFQYRGSDTESQKRDWTDISIRMSDDIHGMRTFPINIKSTHGDTADNVGGWRAYDYAVTNDLTIVRTYREHVESIVKNKRIISNNGDHDYFLWTFFKNGDDQFNGIFDSGSLLSSIPDGNLRFNAAQSLPLQIIHESNDGHNETQLQYMDTDIAKRRVLLETWLIRHKTMKNDEERQLISINASAITS